MFHFQITKYLIYSQSRLRSAVGALDMEFVHLGCQFIVPAGSVKVVPPVTNISFNIVQKAADLPSPRPFVLILLSFVLSGKLILTDSPLPSWAYSRAL